MDRNNSPGSGALLLQEFDRLFSARKVWRENVGALQGRYCDHIAMENARVARGVSDLRLQVARCRRLGEIEDQIERAVAFGVGASGPRLTQQGCDLVREGDLKLKTVKVSAGRSFGATIAELWRYRHLCLHLANADLQSRFRRSALGVVWALIHPLAFTLLYALVLSNVFKQDFLSFSVYVFAGLILWDVIASALTLGSHSIINAAGYLKQSAIPMILFPIRTCLTIMFVFLIGVLSFAIYVAMGKMLFGSLAGITLHWLWALPVALGLFLFAVPLATITALLNVHFRDTQQVLIILTQAIWFSSPVFFAREIFDAPELRFWATINPVVAFSDVFRDPLIYARTPDSADWVVIGIWVVVAWVVAIWVAAASGRRAIFSL